MFIPTQKHKHITSLSPQTSVPLSSGHSSVHSHYKIFQHPHLQYTPIYCVQYVCPPHSSTFTLPRVYWILVFPSSPPHSCVSTHSHSVPVHSVSTSAFHTLMVPSHICMPMHTCFTCFVFLLSIFLLFPHYDVSLNPIPYIPPHLHHISAFTFLYFADLFLSLPSHDCVPLSTSDYLCSLHSLFHVCVIMTSFPHLCSPYSQWQHCVLLTPNSMPAFSSFSTHSCIFLFYFFH